MIRVCLHGVPGDPEAVYEHTIHAFRDLIIVPVALSPSLEVARSMGYSATSMFRTKDQPCLGPTTHELEFRFTSHDGYLLHFNFTGRVDGIESV